MPVPATLAWRMAFGGPEWDQCNQVVQCTDGGFALVGLSESWSSADDLWLVKTGPAGDFEWSSIIGGDQSDDGYAVLQTGDGGFLLAGSTESSGAGLSDAWIVRTDSTGEVLWTRTYGTPEDDYFTSISPTSDGCFVAAGMTGDWPVDTRMYLVKIDPDGNLIWERTFGGGADDYACSAVETLDGGFIIAGKNASSSSGPADGWLLKTDELGFYEWDIITGGAGFDRFNRAVQIENGQYMAAGYSYSPTTGYCDLWLVRATSEGSPLWSVTHGGPYGNESAEWIELSPDGGCFVTGSNGTVNWPDTDLWLLEIDSTGEITWEEFFSGPDGDVGMSLVTTSDGGLAVAGMTRSLGAGDYDYLLAKYLPPFGVPDSEVEEGSGIQLSVLPNPARTSTGIFFVLPAAGEVRLDVFSISGRIVRNLLEDSLAEGQHSIQTDLSNLPAGVYLIRLSGSESSASRILAVL